MSKPLWFLTSCCALYSPAAMLSEIMPTMLKKIIKLPEGECKTRMDKNIAGPHQMPHDILIIFNQHRKCTC